MPVRAGRETMLGKVTPALTAIDARGGKVFVEGEMWNAVSEVAVTKDQLVEIVGIETNKMRIVRPAVDDGAEPTAYVRRSGG